MSLEQRFAELIRDEAAKSFAAILSNGMAAGTPFVVDATIDGMLSAVAAHLVKHHSPATAYGVFQRIADECARSELEPET